MASRINILILLFINFTCNFLNNLFDQNKQTNFKIEPIKIKTKIYIIYIIDSINNRNSSQSIKIPRDIYFLYLVLHDHVIQDGQYCPTIIFVIVIISIVDIGSVCF